MATAFSVLTAALLDALLAALPGAPALAGGRIYANRLRPLSAGQNTALIVRLDNSTAQEVVLGALDWNSKFSIECYARGATGSDAADAVDTLLSDAWARLASVDAAALGAIAITVDPAIEWQFDDGETPVTCAIISVGVQHRTPFATLTAWA